MLILVEILKLVLGRYSECFLVKICLRTSDMTYRSYFCKRNSTLGSVVPLAMFYLLCTAHAQDLVYFCHVFCSFCLASSQVDGGLLFIGHPTSVH